MTLLEEQENIERIRVSVIQRAGDAPMEKEDARDVLRGIRLLASKSEPWGVTSLHLRIDGRPVYVMVTCHG